MKKLFILLHLCVALGYGQNVATQHPFTRPLFESDFTFSDGRMLVSSLPCQLANAMTTDNVLVSVICQMQAFKSQGIQKINDIIALGNDKVRGTVNIRYDYKPAEIKMAYNPELKAWSMTNLYTVTDENGISKQNMLTLDFDSDGKFLLMKRIF